MISRSTAVRTVVILLVVAAFVLFARTIDPDGLVRSLRAIDVRVVAAAALLQLAQIVLASVQWSLLLRAAGARVSAARVFVARFAGYAVGYVTPAAAFGAELSRASLLADASIGARRAAESVIADKVVEIGVKLPFIFVGLSVCTWVLLPPGAHRIPLAGVVAALSAASAVAAAGVLGGRWPVARLGAAAARLGSLVVRLGALAARFGVLGAGLGARRAKAAAPQGTGARRVAERAARWSARAIEGARRIDDGVAAIVASRGLVAGAAALAALANVAELAQISVIVHALGAAGPTVPLVLFSSVVVQGTLAVLPGNLGGMEGTNLLLFRLLRFGPEAALAYTTVLRAGQLCCVAIGALCAAARLISRRRGRLGYALRATATSARSAAAIVSATSAGPCAVETNPASN